MAANPVTPCVANVSPAGVDQELLERLRKRLRVKLGSMRKSRS